MTKPINMNQDKTYCLYYFTKEQAESKGHPLKIIADYNECLQPINSFIWHKLTKEQGWNEGKPLPPFEEWFKIFWENARMESQDWALE